MISEAVLMRIIALYQTHSSSRMNGSFTPLRGRSFQLAQQLIHNAREPPELVV